VRRHGWDMRNALEASDYFKRSLRSTRCALGGSCYPDSSDPPLLLCTSVYQGGYRGSRAVGGRCLGCRWLLNIT